MTINANMDGYYSPYRKGRWVICQAYPLNYNDNYRKLSELSVLSNAFFEIEKASGVHSDLLLKSTWKQ